VELSLTTFILETVNFLILVWILKRLFFSPIKKTIESRRLAIKKSLDDAKSTRADADHLRIQYENRLKDWERERGLKFEELKKELDLERDRRLKEVDKAAIKERERLQVQDEKMRQETRTRQEREAISQSLVFLSKLLSGFASKDLEASIVKGFLNDLEHDSRAQSLLSSEKGLPDRMITIHSAFPLAESERSQILGKLTQNIREREQAKLSVDSALVAGIEVTIGSTVLRANLRDELSYFSQIGRDGV